MLKGKTIIELTDVNTGKKEVHEDENMFTNALNEIFGVMPQLLTVFFASKFKRNGVRFL